MLYTKPYYQPQQPAQIKELVDRVVLGTLVTPHSEGVALSHPVFRLDSTRGALGTVVSHVASASDHVRFLRQGLPSIAILMDPGSYISPSWYPHYPHRDSAPTWGFQVVHLHGTPRMLEEDELVAHLQDLVGHMERGRRCPWDSSELGPGGLERRLPGIVGYEMPVARCEAKFKLGQDERPADMRGAVARLREQNQHALADTIEQHCQLQQP
ncbi:FMN-binding negative transcriptional regulator [Comamonas sediminis]|uniref:FMN-binding negative transcriptional regulator n=1 Tax=Comamonas sediminis TaxID=1783360 RepID=A0ABV4B5F7_9BURK